MKGHTTSLLVTQLTSVLAFLTSVYKDNPWTAVVSAAVLVFTMFPRWRSKLYHLIEKAIEKLGRGDDRCDPQ